ncbi:phage portal protein [Tenggerimyces flavus]|uniref:Phage portal protein n=1 Tax=Tenggerimyces flavus TaxID=1708749 RepID=A0ABV7YB91_9ACTN|nr:phage portal protein [Tenggerimyces flavus]MBM7788862.1 phage portal protein BeeE [Tenggerimyces flavus]
MASLLDKIAAARGPSVRTATRKAWSEPPFWQTDAARLPFLQAFSLTGDKEQIENDFEAYIGAAYKGSGIVFSTIAARQAIFSQTKFAWQTFTNGRGGDLFTNAELALIQQPAPGQTTGELLSRMDVTACLAGNYYATTADDAGRLGRAATGPGRRIVYLRPDWVTIVIGTASDDLWAPDAKIIAYEYWPRSTSVSRPEPVTLLPTEVCHYSPTPDPAARFRGMSPLTPILREIQADKASTLHKERFFSNGAQLSTIIGMKDIDEDGFDEFVEKFNASHQGAANAYKTLFLMGGADVTTVTADLRQLDFKQTQGAGESRIAMALGMHPVIVGMTEGLQGSSLNQGNFGAARRLVADKTMRPLWDVAAASLQTLLTPPSSATQLVPDLRGVAFLREDAADSANIQGLESRSIRTLLDAGYLADSVVEAVTTGDWTRLKHSGLFSVQLQPPGTATPATPAEPPAEEETA